MENASKALIMASEILIGVMIISIAVYLFNIMGQYSAETTAEMEETQVAQFNNQFLKFYGTTNGETIKCTIHDIVGLANLAKQANEANGFSGIEDISDFSYYIQIDLGNTKNLEAKSQKDLISLIKENDITVNAEGQTGTKFFYVAEVGLGEYTQRVNHMIFKELNK